MNNIKYISLLIWIPIFLGLINFFIKNKKLNNILPIIYLIIFIVISLILLFLFKNNESNFQFIEKYELLNSIKLNYILGLDGLSILFIPLIFIFSLISTIISLKNIKNNLNIYIGLILILSGLMIGVFSSLNILLFYIFLELTLIPIFIIIGIWGGENKIYASLKLFIYTLIGSFLMLISIIYLYIKYKNLDIYNFYKMNLSIKEQIFIFISFFIAFSIKIPIFPFHTWLPYVHVEAPTGGSIILASIMLKFGGYGFLRFLLPIIHIKKNYSYTLIILSIISTIYSGITTIAQKNIKKLIAYSSINHMSIASLGIFLMNIEGINGSIIQMISHSIISCGLFMLIGILYKQKYYKNLIKYKGIINKMPKFSFFFLILLISNCSLPITSGFVGEFLIIIGLIRKNLILGIIISINLIISAIYSLLVIKNIIFGKKTNNNKNFKDINKIEFLILNFIILLILIIGIYPRIITYFIKNFSINLIKHKK